jgi:hypothetical protein
MPGTAVVASGNYILEVDTGYDWGSFTLNDTTKGVLNNTTYTLGPNVTYADITAGVLSVDIMRGRKDIGDQFTHGHMGFVLTDSKYTSMIFNPFDTSSPYYDPATAQPGLAPLRKIRFGRYDSTNTVDYLFCGYIVNYGYTFNLGGIDTVSVSCADDFYILAQTQLAAWNPSEEISGTRLTNLLDKTEVAYPATTRNIATGTVTLGGSAAYTVANGTSVAAYANKINQAEQGRIFISRGNSSGKGVFTFQNRIGNTLGTSMIDFHDDGAVGTAPYNGVSISFQGDQVCNRASVTIAGSSSPQVADNTASQAKYLIQSQSITDSLLHNDTAAATLASYLVVANPVARFNELDTNLPMISSTALREAAVTVDIGDVITIQKNIVTGPSTNYQMSQSSAVEGIAHNINFSQGHSITYYTSPTTIVYQLILNDPVYGTLDTTNVLG